MEYRYIMLIMYMASMIIFLIALAQRMVCGSITTSIVYLWQYWKDVNTCHDFISQPKGYWHGLGLAEHMWHSDVALSNIISIKAMEPMVSQELWYTYNTIESRWTQGILYIESMMNVTEHSAQPNIHLWQQIISCILNISVIKVNFY